MNKQAGLLRVSESAIIHRVVEQAEMKVKVFLSVYHDVVVWPSWTSTCCLYCPVSVFDYEDSHGAVLGN